MLRRMYSRKSARCNVHYWMLPATTAAPQRGSRGCAEVQLPPHLQSRTLRHQTKPKAPNRQPLPSCQPRRSAEATVGGLPAVVVAHSTIPSRASAEAAHAAHRRGENRSGWRRVPEGSAGRDRPAGSYVAVCVSCHPNPAAQCRRMLARARRAASASAILTPILGALPIPTRVRKVPSIFT